MTSPLRVLLVGSAALLSILVLNAARAPSAEAKVTCDAVGHMYPQPTFFYAIAGIRCSKKVRKIVVSGYIFGSRPGDPMIELRKSCLNAVDCMILTPNRKNPPGMQRWRIVYAGGFQEHWYSIPPTYKGFNKYFWF